MWINGCELFVRPTFKSWQSRYEASVERGIEVYVTVSNVDERAAFLVNIYKLYLSTFSSLIECQTDCRVSIGLDILGSSRYRHLRRGGSRLCHFDDLLGTVKSLWIRLMDVTTMTITSNTGGKLGNVRPIILGRK